MSQATPFDWYKYPGVMEAQIEFLLPDVQLLTGIIRFQHDGGNPGSSTRFIERMAFSSKSVDVEPCVLGETVLRLRSDCFVYMDLDEPRMAFSDFQIVNNNLLMNLKDNIIEGKYDGIVYGEVSVVSGATEVPMIKAFEPVELSWSHIMPF